MVRKKMSLRAKAILLVSLFLLTTNLALGTVLARQASSFTRTQINEHMLDIVKTAAGMLDGDALERLTPEDADTPEYRAVLDILRVYKENTGLEYIYCVRMTGDKEFTFGIDPDPITPAEFNSPFAYSDALYAASQGTPSVDNESATDRWGRFYSAYCPVFNSDGKVSAIVSADFSADWYEAQLSLSRRTILIGCGLFLALGIAVTVALTGKYTRSLGEIRENLYELEEELNSLTKESSGNSGEVTPEAGEPDDLRAIGEQITEIRSSLRDHIEHTNTQANSMITAMASDYRSVYYVNLDENDGVCYRGDPTDIDQTVPGIHFPYLERFTWYAEHCVTEPYREAFITFIQPDEVREKLAAEPLIAFRYLARRDGREYYEMIRMAGVRRAEERDDHTVHAVGLGFTVIDEEMRESMAKNEALAEALSLAEEASKAKTAFLSNMSHEIRTPMNAIIGLDTLALNDKGISEQTRDYLEKIGGSARHLLGLINDILDMSRIESGRLVLRREEFSFRGILDQINTMVMSQCRDKGLTYECRVLSQVDDYYIGDETKLKEVLINILSNAIKFTEAPGSVTLSVERTAVFDNQSTLRFRIKDTGIGMDKEFIPKIFEAFSQENSGTKNKYGSTGLGMAITKSIVEMLNGTISVESEKGVGTEFTVMITLENSDRRENDGAAAASEKAARAAEGEAERAVLAGRRILLAEDVEINAEIMMDILDMEEIAADHAENGRIALEMFSNSSPGTYAAVLMDVRMPEMDGLEAAAAIRALDRPDAGRIPIIALTANAFDEDVQRSLQAGMNAHLSKPVEPEHLYDTLAKLIYESEK